MHIICRGAFAAGSFVAKDDGPTNRGCPKRTVRAIFPAYAGRACRCSRVTATGWERHGGMAADYCREPVTNRDLLCMRVQHSHTNGRRIVALSNSSSYVVSFRSFYTIFKEISLRTVVVRLLVEGTTAARQLKK